MFIKSKKLAIGLCFSVLFGTHQVFSEDLSPVIDVDSEIELSVKAYEWQGEKNVSLKFYVKNNGTEKNK